MPPHFTRKGCMTMVVNGATSSLAHRLSEYQKDFYKEASQDKSLGGLVKFHVIGTALTGCITLILHAEAVRRAVIICFISIAKIFSQTNEEILETQQKEWTFAYSESLKSFCALFNRKMLITADGASESKPPETLPVYQQPLQITAEAPILFNHPVAPAEQMEVEVEQVPLRREPAQEREPLAAAPAPVVDPQHEVDVAAAAPVEPDEDIVHVEAADGQPPAAALAAVPVAEPDEDLVHVEVADGEPEQQPLPVLAAVPEAEPDDGVVVGAADLEQPAAAPAVVPPAVEPVALAVPLPAEPPVEHAQALAFGDDDIVDANVGDLPAAAPAAVPPAVEPVALAVPLPAEPAVLPAALQQADEQDDGVVIGAADLEQPAAAPVVPADVPPVAEPVVLAVQQADEQDDGVVIGAADLEQPAAAPVVPADVPPVAEPVVLAVQQADEQDDGVVIGAADLEQPAAAPVVPAADPALVAAPVVVVPPAVLPVAEPAAAPVVVVPAAVPALLAAPVAAAPAAADVIIIQDGDHLDPIDPIGANQVGPFGPDEERLLKLDAEKADLRRATFQAQLEPLSPNAVARTLKQELIDATAQMAVGSRNLQYLVKPEDEDPRWKLSNGFIGPHQVGICHFAKGEHVLGAQHLAAAIRLTVGGNAVDVPVFGIFDPQVGFEASKFLGQKLLTKLTQELNAHNPDALSEDGIWNSLTKTFLKLNSEFLSKYKKTAVGTHGSSAGLVLLIDNHVWVAHLGNTRIAIDNGGQPIQMTTDPDPKNPKYRELVESLGGNVDRDGRVNGKLDMATGFGRYDLQGAISGKPFLTRYPMARLREGSHLIIATSHVATATSTAMLAGWLNKHQLTDAKGLASNVVYSIYKDNEKGDPRVQDRSLSCLVLALNAIKDDWETV
jgi:serine/threonine protein phosphatase PrpC